MLLLACFQLHLPFHNIDILKFTFECIEVHRVYATYFSVNMENM